MSTWHERFARLEEAVGRAKQWTTLDWNTDETPTPEEIELVEANAEMAADRGDEGLECWESGNYKTALQRFGEAVCIEHQYGDAPCWSPVLELARRLLAEFWLPDWEGL